MIVDLASLPIKMRSLPTDPQRGVPVPWFVLWQDGKPEFRIMDHQKFARAIREKLCWCCGQKLGVHMAFVIGPMCAINRTSSEPPCHLECARWSAINCPFLARPHMVRREGGLPEDVSKGGAMLERNPGATGVWVTREYELFKAPNGASATGYLLTMGEPTNVEWYAEGRAATREEVTTSIDTGLPFLEQMCDTEATVLRRMEAHKVLKEARVKVETLLPA